LYNVYIALKLIMCTTDNKRFLESNKYKFKYGITGCVHNEH